MQRSDLWVFGYGSLMWNPGFDVIERRPARLDGFKRCFSLASWHYRGTREQPGLVLGLDWAPGQSCTGVALRVCPSQDRAVRKYLGERELVSYAYFETLYPVSLLDDDSKPEALCYIVDRTHAQYAGGLGIDEQARIIARARGSSGPNRDYLMATLDKLNEMSIEDDELTSIAALVSRDTDQ